MKTGRSNTPPSEFLFTDDDFAALSARATRITGISLPPTKRDMIYGRLARRLRALNLPDFSAYHLFIDQPSNRCELVELVNSITTPVSHFWREPHHFDHLAQVVLPAKARLHPGQEIRLWAAGCAAGQEAYMLAMVLAQNGLPGKILATDINTAALKTAQAGFYDTRELDLLPEALRKRYWQQQAGTDRWRASPALRERLVFKPLNFQTVWPLRTQFDAIFCRNVMIYFDAPQKRYLLNRFATQLRPGGWLYIGHAETIMPQQSPFKMAGRTIYQLNI